MQVSVKGQVNDSTYTYGRLRYDMNFKGKDKRDAYMNTLYVHHDFNGKAGLTLGRMDLFLGQTGLQYDDTFDGAMAKQIRKKKETQRLPAYTARADVWLMMRNTSRAKTSMMHASGAQALLPA